MKDSRVNPSVDYNYPIICTFKNSNDRVDDYNYPIRFAYRNSNDKVVEILLKDKRVDLSTKDNYVIKR